MNCKSSGSDKKFTSLRGDCFARHCEAGEASRSNLKNGLATDCAISERARNRLRNLSLRLLRSLCSLAMTSLVLLFILNPAALAQGSRAADFLFEVGKEYYEQGDYEQALHELGKALLVEPGHTRALMYIQLIEEKLGLAQEEEMEEIEGYAEELAREEAMERALEEAEARIAPSVIAAPAPPVIAAPAFSRHCEEAQSADEAISGEEIASLATLARNDEEEKTNIISAALDKFDGLIEEVNEEIAPARISGEYTVSLGVREDEVIWKEANADYNEVNWRRVNSNFGINTYDTRVYDRLCLNLDTENEEGFNLHTNITLDPWSFIGKSNKVTVTSADGGSAEIQLKYWSNTRSTINENVYSDRLNDVFSLPEIKVVDGKALASSGLGIEWSTGADTFNIPEMEIHEELWPIRELWVDYNSGDEFQCRFFPIAFQDQALTSDDPLGLSNHMIYWEESPWLDRWRPGMLSTSSASAGFAKGQWEDDLSFFTRDSNMTRLTSLRGFSVKNRAWENVTIESTVASPKGLWQDYDAFDNIQGAGRIKWTPSDELQLGLLSTLRYGLEEGSRDAENKVIAVDFSYTPGACAAQPLQIKGEVAYSRDERDLTKEPYDTKNVGNAYSFELQKGKVQEERPAKWIEEIDEETIEESEPFDYALRLNFTHMDKGFYPALASYRLTRKDPFWGRHIHFEEPYEEYYGGPYCPSLTWDDIRQYRIGDSVDIDRDVVGLRLEKAFFDEDLITLLDCRNAHEASGGKYIETISRAEAGWQANEKLLIKFLGVYHDLPNTTGGKDPVIYNVDTNEFVDNEWIEGGKDPSLKTASCGLKYNFLDWLSFDFIYEYTNDFTVGLDNYPRSILSNPNFSSYVEDGLVWREPITWLYDQYLFPTPPYPWFNIYKAGFNIKPAEDLRLRLEFTKNDYKFAGQIDDNINHIGFEADYDMTENLSLKFNYTYSKCYNVQERGEGLDYKGHHNVFVSLDYRFEDKGVFTVQFGEAAIQPYSTMVFTSPYGGFLPTLDTAHIVRAYFSRKF